MKHDLLDDIRVLTRQPILDVFRCDSVHWDGAFVAFRAFIGAKVFIIALIKVIAVIKHRVHVRPRSAHVPVVGRHGPERPRGRITIRKPRAVASKSETHVFVTFYPKAAGFQVGLL